MKREYSMRGWIAALLIGTFLFPAAVRADYFSEGDYIIPMDSVLQPYNYDSTVCTDTDYGIMQAYGLVYKLLDAGVTVYWIINPNPNRTGSYNAAYPDMTLSGAAPVVELHPDSDTRGSAGLSSATEIKYYGGPFVINVQNPSVKTKVDNVIATWVADPANSRVNRCPTDVKHVTIHVSKVNFSAPVGRVMRGTPPKIALLDEGSNVNILRGYLYIAGLGATGGIYDLVTPAQVKNGALDKVGNEYPYNILWAPHWEGTKYYSEKVWDPTQKIYPGTKNLAGSTLGQIVTLATDNITVTTDDSTNFGSLNLGDNVVFFDKNDIEVFQKPVAGWNASTKTIIVSTPLSAAEQGLISGNSTTWINVDKKKSNTSVLKLKNWDTHLVVGLAVKLTDKNGNIFKNTTLTAVDAGQKKVTLASPITNGELNNIGQLGWDMFSWTGSVGLTGGTLVDDDLVVQKVAEFLEGGNALFAECASIEVFEGSPFGRFLSTRFAGSTSDPGGHANLAKNGLKPQASIVVTQLSPSSPFAQIGDFDYYNTGGHLHNWKAMDSSGQIAGASTYPGSAYYAGTTRYVHLADNTQTTYDNKDGGPVTWYDSGWDAAVGGHYRGDQDKGYVFYLGGHKYVQSSFTGNADGTYTGLYPNADADSNADHRGGVAGIRYVLNTLLNLRYEVQVKEFVRSSPVATADHQLFLGSFEYPGYRGHFRSYNALANDVSTGAYTFFDAAQRFPVADARRLYYKSLSSAQFKPFTTTNLYTDFPGAFTGLDAQSKEALVNRYRGKEARIDESTGAYLVDGTGNLIYDESWKLGPVHYSTPAIVGYSSNVVGGTTRPRVTYVVDGWGVLHAFFTPRIPKIPDVYPAIDNTWGTTEFADTVNGFPTKYKLSGTLNVAGAGNVTLTNLEPGAEIYGWVTDSNELNYLKDFGTWYTKGISASPKTADLLMEVSTGVKRYRTILAVPQGEGTTNVPILDVTDPLAPTLKYILKSNTAGDAYSHIGHSKSFAIGRVWVNNGTIADVRNYLFYATESMETSGGNPVPGITMAAVDLDTGQVAWRVTMPYADSSTPNDIPGGPSIVDANGDGIYDYVFAGDYEGRVWGLYTSQTGRKDSNGNPIPGGASMFGTIGSSPVPLANVGSTEPVGVVPTVYREGTRLNVVFGTGGTDWAPSVNASTGADIFYHVYSYDANDPVPSPTLSSGGATQQWVYTLPAGEKVYGGIVKAGPYLFLGTAYGTALNKTDPTADIPTTMAKSGHLIILQATGATTDAQGNSIDREVASIEVGKMVAAVDIRHGKIYYTALTTGDNPTNIVLKDITGIGSADASLIGSEGGPGNRIEILYWREL
ncbi:MAG: hypothetical protein Kow00128_12950 [Deltaproteobacteria bacterium]